LSGNGKSPSTPAAVDDRFIGDCLEHDRHISLPSMRSEETCYRADRIGGAVCQIDAAIAIEIDSMAAYRPGHELRKSNGTCERTIDRERIRFLFAHQQ